MPTSTDDTDSNSNLQIHHARMVSADSAAIAHSPVEFSSQYSNHFNYHHRNQHNYHHQMADHSYFASWVPQGTDKCQYLKQLLQDKKHLNNFMCLSPIGFHHLDKLLEHEIVKVRSVLFQNTERPAMALPDADGTTIVKTHKVWVPVKENPEYNFVGRILGPRGLTAKQLEQETQCKIMVRGRGSMRDKKKEEMNRGKQNWEHLNEELHVLITVEDTENRANVKIQRAVDEINKLLVPQQDGEDDLKKKQLMELAIINGTYRDNSTPAKNPRLIQGAQILNANFQGQSGAPQMNATVTSIASPNQGGYQPHVSTQGQPIFTPPPNVQGPNSGFTQIPGNQVQIQQSQHSQMRQQQAAAQQQAQNQQQLLGFAPVVAATQFRPTAIIAPGAPGPSNFAPAALNSPGDSGQQVGQTTAQASQANTIYYQTADSQPQFAYAATQFVPAFYQPAQIDQSYIMQQQQLHQQQQQQVVQAQVSAVQQQQSVSAVTPTQASIDEADAKDQMTN